MSTSWWMRKENERLILGGGTLVFAILVLLPFLGTYGLWDPQEITVADAAQRVAKGQTDFVDLWHHQPPLTVWLIGTSVKLFGASELSARLPLALLGILGAVTTYALGVRLGRRRGGAIAAVVLLSSPLYVFQARELVSDLATVVAGAIAMLGLVGLAWPEPQGPPWRRTADLALTAAGLALGLASSGLFLGVLVPLAAAAVGSLAFSPSRRFAVGAGTAAVALLGVLFFMIFHTEAAQPGMRALFGRMLVGAREYLPWVGGAWRHGEAPITVGFDNTVNQVAFGMFPWSAIAPIAVLRFALVRSPDRSGWAGVVLLAWATVAYLATSIWWRCIGEARYAALPAIALAIGIFIDDLLAAKLDGDDARAPNAASGQRIAAIFVLLAAGILALDTHNFNDTLPSIHLLGSAAVFPKQLMLLEDVIVFFGFAFGALAGTGLFVASGDGKLLRVERRIWTTGGLLGAVGLGGLFGLFLSLVLVPKLSQHYSYKNLFQAYSDHRRDSEPVGVMGIPGSGPEFYAHGSLTRLDSTPQLMTFLHRPERVFAIVPHEKLCEVRQVGATASAPVHVLDNKNSRFILFTNQLVDGEKDESPLTGTFHAEAPAKLSRPVQATFEDAIDLVGADLPEHVGHGDTFKVTLWYKVKKRPAQNYKVFAHFDGPGQRFQGDHDQPGVCPSTSWQAGDVVSDTFDVVAGGLTNPSGTYTLWIGFFTGGNGIYKNAHVTSGEHDTNDRVNIGPIRVE